MNQVAIYLILDESERPRYVGRTFHSRRRPLDHLRKHPEWANSSRILEVVSEGFRWQDRERYWIAYYRRFAPLENLARGGGSAGPKSPDTIRRHREKMIGRKASAESLARRAATVARKSPEERAAIGRRISEAKKGKVPNWSAEGKQRTIDALRKLGSPMKGKKHSEESRKLIGEKGKGRPPNSGSFQRGVFRPKSESWKLKRRLSQLGKKLSEETKQKIREKRALQDMSSHRKPRISEGQLCLDV